MQPAQELQPIHPIIVEAVTLFNRMEEIQQEIARRAYALFEARGSEHGHAFDDWAAAEAELLAPVAIAGNESADKLEVTAEVPGFNEKEIEVAVEPRRLFLSGKQEKTNAANPADTEVTERKTKMFFRVIDLPAEIDPAQAKAHFKDGRLTLTLPRLKEEVIP
jgi:HSP20 family molecular chaperone IbpA